MASATLFRSGPLLRLARFVLQHGFLDVLRVEQQTHAKQCERGARHSVIPHATQPHTYTATAARAETTHETESHAIDYACGAGWRGEHTYTQGLRTIGELRAFQLRSTWFASVLFVFFSQWGYA